jgi:hypothetical protein
VKCNILIDIRRHSNAVNIPSLKATYYDTDLCIMVAGSELTNNALVPYRDIQSQEIKRDIA